MTGWRYIAQALPSGEWLEWDLPLSDVEVTSELSGPGGLSGTVPVEFGRLKRADGSPLLQPWGSAIWVEAAGQIRGGGILVRSQFDGPVWRVECVGLSGYAAGQPWTGPEFNGVKVDPLSIVRRVWTHLQSQPDGDLGVVVDETSSPVRIGAEKEDVEFQTGGGDDVAFESGPFKLNPWTTSDVGKVVDDLAASTPFDYVTHTDWAVDGSETLDHRLELAYPRRGSRRNDLRFVVGENVTVDPVQVADGDGFASEVLALGAGEGRDVVRTVLSERRGRLRRAVTVADKSAKSKRALTGVARAVLRASAGVIDIAEVLVADSPLAEVASIIVGDEIFVQSDAGWLDLDMWVRVLAVSTRPDALDMVRLQVARSEGV